MLHVTASFLRDVYSVVRPFGRLRLVLVLFVMMMQGLFQMLGTTAIFPFLKLVTDPSVRQQWTGDGFPGELFADWSQQQLVAASGIFAIVMIFLSNAVSIAAIYFRVRYVQLTGHHLRLNLLKHITSQPYEYFLGVNRSVLAKKVTSDVNTFTQSILLPLLSASARGITVFFLVIALVVIQPWIAIAVAVGLVAYYAAVFQLLRNRRQRSSEATKDADRGLFFVIAEVFGAIKTVFTHDCQEHFFSSFAYYSRRKAHFSTTTAIYANAPRALLEPLAYSGLVVWVLYAVFRDGNLTAIIPAVGVVAMVSYRLLPSIQTLYADLTILSVAGYALEEIIAEFNVTPPTAHRKARQLAAAPIALGWHDHLELSHLCYSYPDTDKNVVRDVSLRVSKGERVGFVGPTGSGKSTLVDIITGLLIPSRGSILVDGHALTPKDLIAWRVGMGYVPQDVCLLDASIGDNIAFGIDESDIDQQRLVESARIAQILDFIQRDLPEQFETFVGERGMRLSGGQRQRIGLARAMYRRPQLLILDEATSALDNTTEADFLAAIDELPNDVTILMIAHRLSTVQHCDVICYFDNGQIMDKGSFTQLSESCQDFRNLSRQAGLRPKI